MFCLNKYVNILLCKPLLSFENFRFRSSRFVRIWYIGSFSLVNMDIIDVDKPVENVYNFSIMNLPVLFM